MSAYYDVEALIAQIGWKYETKGTRATQLDKHFSGHCLTYHPIKIMGKGNPKYFLSKHAKYFIKLLLHSSQS